MRYYLNSSSLIVRGKFRVCSSSLDGGIRDCTTLINHQVSKNFSGDPERELETLVLSLGLSKKSTAGLLTAVSMNTLCILSWDSLTVFITAGVTHPDPVGLDKIQSPPTAGTINIIVMVQNFSDQGLVDAVITVTEAKSLALRNIGHSFAGTVTDAVAIATEGSGDVRYAGSATEIGQRIHATVFFGTQQALMRQTGVIQRKKPSFFIQSSMGGSHWIEWEKKNCPYYPCHFEGQWCDFCYCPLYPCGDTTLGDWIEKPGKASVWSCTRCTLNHDPRVTSHLKRNPEASLEELKALFLKI